MANGIDLADLMIDRIDGYVAGLSDPPGSNIDRRELFNVMYEALYEFFAGVSGKGLPDLIASPGMIVNTTVRTATNALTINGANSTTILSGTITLKTTNPVLLFFYHEPQTTRTTGVSTSIEAYVDGALIGKINEHHPFWNVGAGFRIPIDGVLARGITKPAGTYPLTIRSIPYAPGGGTLTHSFQNRERRLIVLEVAQ